MSNNFLDKAGLSHFWNKIKEYVGGYLPLMRTVTLTASGWSNNSQTVTVQGVLADSTKQAITVTPSTKTNMNNASSAGVWCASQGANSLTFTCDSVPTSDITFNIEIQEAIS